MRWNKGSWRLWLFRGLVAIACGLMVASFTMPWWTVNLFSVLGTSDVRHYAWGLRHTLVELRPYIEKYETTFYQEAILWTYLVVSVLLVLYSTWLKERKGSWLLGSVGLIYIAYAAITLFVIASNLKEIAGSVGFPISLLGLTTISLPWTTITIQASLGLGYYLAYVVGGMCIALALLRTRIIGKLARAI